MGDPGGSEGHDRGGGGKNEDQGGHRYHERLGGTHTGGEGWSDGYGEGHGVVRGDVGGNMGGTEEFGGVKWGSRRSQGDMGEERFGGGSSRMCRVLGEFRGFPTGFGGSEGPRVSPAPSQGVWRGHQHLEGFKGFCRIWVNFQTFQVNLVNFGKFQVKFRKFCFTRIWVSFGGGFLQDLGRFQVDLRGFSIFQEVSGRFGSVSPGFGSISGGFGGVSPGFRWTSWGVH